MLVCFEGASTPDVSLHTCTLIGEEDLGLNTHGKSNTLAGGALQKRLGRHGSGRSGTISGLALAFLTHKTLVS